MTLSNEWYNTELENSELETLHRSPTVEYSFYNAVRSGDMEAVIKNCSEDEFIRLEGTGVLSRNALKISFCCHHCNVDPLLYRWWARTRAGLQAQ